MIGCDVAKISRFVDKSNAFVCKILSKDELKEFRMRANNPEYLASRWSAKESVYKATGIRNATILNDDQGCPYVLHEPNIHVTISHDGEYVFTVALDKRNG